MRAVEMWQSREEQPAKSRLRSGARATRVFEHPRHITPLQQDLLHTECRPDRCKRSFFGVHKHRKMPAAPFRQLGEKCCWQSNAQLLLYIHA
eukprot:s170_g13.t1